jgi:transcriptional regulator with XRE-family HTH domain/quercetin dioxygenase-like cupin family protein
MPVFSSHLLDYEGLGVGNRIRDERRRKGLTLRQVSARMAVSQATLSNIETDKVAPDLAELARVAQALEIPVATLLPRSRMLHYFIKRATDFETQSPVKRELVGPEPGPSVHHNSAWPLADPFVGKHMEPVRAQVWPLPDNDLHFIAHDHEEFMFVLHGEVETILKTNEELTTEHLAPGDCIYFRSNLPHCHRSTNGLPAETINVMYSLRGPTDPDDGELDSFGRSFYRRGIYADAAREASEKIGLLRRSHGIGLAALARELGMGSRLLARIESGERAPNVDLLVRLARRFRRPIEYFFATTLESQPYYFVQRANAIKELPLQYQRSAVGQGNTHLFRPLASGFPEGGMHPYYVQLMTLPLDAMGLDTHHGQEFIHVLEGEVRYLTGADGGQVELLRPGDSIFLDSSVPHLLQGNSQNPFAATRAEVLEVFWSPLGTDYLFRN